MGYLSIGYYTICLSSVFSSVLFVTLLFGVFLETELEQPVFLGMNISIIIIQACGIVLCAIGYRKHETIESLSVPLSVVLTVLLILWGSFIVCMVSNYVFLWKTYEKLMLMRKTVQFAAYVAWAIKGTIGLISGLIFIGKLLLSKSKTEHEFGF
jgi:hypothetical protein